jgi:hypothetical protein
MSEARKAGAILKSINVRPFFGTDTSKGGLEPRKFFMKAEVFAATKGFKRALLEDRVLPSWSGKEELLPDKEEELPSWSGKEELLTDKEEELMRQDDKSDYVLQSGRVRNYQIA